MIPTLTVAVILFAGFVFGELSQLIKLPKVTGYIMAGILLNPSFTGFISKEFVDHTGVITHIALAFITFSVGATLERKKLKKMGRMLLSLTLMEAEMAFAMVAVGFMLVGPLLLPDSFGGFQASIVPLALLAGSMASPTDPSATLAVRHEYKARGEVSSTIMGIAAFDDMLGLINYSIALAVAGVFAASQKFSVATSIGEPLLSIGLALLIGASFGFILNQLTKWIPRETEGMLLVLILSLMLLSYGIANLLNADELLSTMAMGVVVVNYNPLQKKIFQMLERYTDELIFVLFFTISGMMLDLKVLGSAWELIILFVVSRALGKFIGMRWGGHMLNASQKVKKYAVGGLIPQGGIVIGLALMIKQYEEFSHFSHVLINIIIGATVVHEILGPLLAKLSLTKANEIQTSGKK